MSAAMDVAYLDAPYIAHVPRQAVMLRMCGPCWEDACQFCWEGPCICACHDDPPVPGRDARQASAPRCPRCRYLVTTAGHLVACDPESVTARITVLAGMIGGRT